VAAAVAVAVAVAATTVPVPAPAPALALAVAAAPILAAATAVTMEVVRAMTSKVHPAAGARMVTGIVSSIALVGMVTGFAYNGKIEEAKAALLTAKAETNAQAAAGVSAFVAAEQAKVAAAKVAKAAKAAKVAQARRAAATIARSTVIPAAPSGSAAAPAPAPARPRTTAPAPAPAQPTVPVGGTSGGSKP